MKSERSLPTGWVWAEFGSVASVASNLVSPVEHPDLPHVAPDNIERDTGRLLPVRTVEADGVTSPNHLFRSGQLLYSKIRPNLNKCVRVGFAGLCSADMYPVDSAIDTGYLHHYILSDEFVSAVTRAAGSRTVLPKTNQQQLAVVAVPVAPLSEESRIADALDGHLSRLDAAVASLERAQARLKAYRASVLKAAVEGRLVPTEAELARKERREYEPASVLLTRILKERRRRWEEAELARLTKAGKPPKDDRWKAKYEEPAAPDTRGLPALPEGWCWATVEQVGDVLLGRQRAPQYLTGRFTQPYLRVANIKDNAIDYSDIEQMDFDDDHLRKYSLSDGDILVSEGQSPHLVGQSAIYRGSINNLCFQKTLHRFRPVPMGPASSFAQIVFRAHVKLGLFMALAPITTNIAHLTLDKFKTSRFPLPPQAEQERIECEVSRLLSVGDEVADDLGRQSKHVGRLRQSILKWAFEGKLVDQDPNDEPAEKLLARIRTERADSMKSHPSRGRRAKGAP